MTTSEKATISLAALGVVAAGAVGLWEMSSEYRNQIGRIERLEEQVRSLESKTTGTASALAELARKPTIAVDPIQQKCIELAEQVRTGAAGSKLATSYGEDVIRRATASMKELGCASTGR